jgi:hypothetical protein
MSSLGTIPGTTGTANRAGVLLVFFPTYSGTTFHKTSWVAQGMLATTFSVASMVCGWRSTSAISQIDLHFNAIGTGFVNGSICSLYGGS